MRQSGLAAAGRPHNRHEVTVFDNQTDAAKGVDLILTHLIGFADVLYFDHRLSVLVGFGSRFRCGLASVKRDYHWICSDPSAAFPP